MTTTEIEVESTVIEELEAIRRKSKDGKLYPEAVVAFAQNPDTVLHNKFTWDDTEAAKKHRLWEARQLISVAVTVVMEDHPAYRAYVSLRAERQAGGGYRSLAVILRTPSLYAAMLDDALAEVERLKEKYGRLKELKPLWVAAKRVRAQRQKKVA